MAIKFWAANIGTLNQGQTLNLSANDRLLDLDNTTKLTTLPAVDGTYKTANDAKMDFTLGGGIAKFVGFGIWNTTKSFKVDGNPSDLLGNKLVIENIVDARLNLTEGGKRCAVSDTAVDLTIDGVKRAEVETGNGADKITIGSSSNEAGWRNGYEISTNGGDDIITFRPATAGTFVGFESNVTDGRYAEIKVDAGKGNDTVDTTLLVSNAKVLAGKGNDLVKTGAGADTLQGDAGNDTLDAGAGDDTLNGGDGDDLLAGGLGADLLRGGAGNDILRGDLNDIDNQGIIDGNDTMYGGAGNDRIGGKGGNDQLFGGRDNDEIWGDLGNDTLKGGQDNGKLKVTGTGDDAVISKLVIGDTLIGGIYGQDGGNDTFIYGRNSGETSGVDLIIGFNNTSDILQLTGSLASIAEIVDFGDAGDTTILFSNGAGGYLSNAAIILDGVTGVTMADLLA
jgi:Ca2+-binding RTX toxin-like protein